MGELIFFNISGTAQVEKFPKEDVKWNSKLDDTLGNNLILISF